MKPLIAATLFLSAFPVWAEPNCSRGELQRAANSYIAAQQAGNPSLMQLEDVTHYIYNMNDSTLDESIVNMALDIDHHRSFMDTTTCQTYTEVVVSNPEHPYVLATRLRVVAGKILEMESVVTDEGDLFFNADVYLEKSSSEDWYPLSPSERASRTELVAAANAYFDQFFSGPNSTPVPWGRPCNRLEGAFTAAVEQLRIPVMSVCLRG